MEYNLINYKPAIARLGDDIELYKILITFWFEKKQFSKEELLNLEKTGTNNECITYIHSLKGVAANIGAEKLQMAAQKPLHYWFASILWMRWITSITVAFCITYCAI